MNIDRVTEKTTTKARLKKKNKANKKITIER